MLGVLHISTWDNVGGSGRAAYRVHTGLRQLGVRSRMLVGFKSTRDPDVSLVAPSWIRLGDRVVGRGLDRLSLQSLLYPSSFALRFRRWFREADVVQLYNTHGGYFSHTALPILTRRRPVVWRLSDMWPLTGHCSYSYDCERWKAGCGSCPSLSGYPALRRDTTALLWTITKKVYARSRLTIVAPSAWIARLAGESPLLGRFPIHVIPNGLDTGVFRPIAMPEARQTLGLEKEGKVVLFSAASLLETRKGGALLGEALQRLDSSSGSPTAVLVVGAARDGIEVPWPFRTTWLGAVEDDAVLALAYSAADVFVLPTLADNLPNGPIESMACGTPVVAFDVGGVPEAVRHLDTGYLAAYKDAGDLARGIEMILGSPDLRSRLSRRCRGIVEREYSLELQAKRYLSLYEETIRRHNEH